MVDSKVGKLETVEEKFDPDSMKYSKLYSVASKTEKYQLYIGWIAAGNYNLFYNYIINYIYKMMLIFCILILILSFLQIVKYKRVKYKRVKYHIL